MPIWLDWSLAALVIAAAGVVRGYAGFGFSAISVACLCLWRSPAEVVPVIFMLEIAASVVMLREVWSQSQPRWLIPLVGGSLIGIPLGVWLLATLQGPWLQASVSAAMLGCVLAVRSGWRPRWAESANSRWGTGVVAGVLNGLAAIGGMVCAVMLYAAALPAAAMRATLVLLFFWTDLYSLAWAGGLGLLNPGTLRDAALGLIPMTAGILFGQRFFKTSSEQQFRTRVFGLLAFLCALGLLKAGWGMVMT